MIDELFNFPTDKMPSIETISSELLSIISIEYNAQLRFTFEQLHECFGQKRDEVEEYLIDRISKTSNPILKVRYYHFLYVFIRNNKYKYKYGEDAIAVYQSILDRYISDPETGHNVLHFQEILKIIVGITESMKLEKDDLKSQIHGYLQDQNFHYKLKTRIVQLLKETKLFKIAELNYLPSLCYNLSSMDTNPNFVEMILLLGLDFAKRLNDVKHLRIINGMLGDNEYRNIKVYDGELKNIIIPHYNSNSYKKIIHYYRNAKQKDKLSKALLEYTANKKNCKLLKMSVSVERKNYDQMCKLLDEVFISIINSPTKSIIIELIFGESLMFTPDVLLENYAEENKNKPTNQLFTQVVIDINNNEKQVDLKEHLRSKRYMMTLSETLTFTFQIVMASIENRKLSYKKIATALDKTAFGNEKITYRNEKSITYTWFSLVDIGIKSFFDQCNLIRKDKSADWRFSIEFLSLKFEAILRDIVRLLGGVITEVDDNGNSKELLLDKLLSNPVLMEVFNADDMNLFKYTLTSKGYNIRNDVAHSFYKPQDYNMGKAVLVLLCILRLAKFVPPTHHSTDISNSSQTEDSL